MFTSFDKIFKSRFNIFKTAIENRNLQITVDDRWLWLYLKMQMINVLLIHSATSHSTHFQIHHEIYIHMEIEPCFIQRKQFIHQKILNFTDFW